MTALEAVLEYENPHLVGYFADKAGLPVDEAEELFVDLKRWLWLGAQRSEDAFPVQLFQDLSILDEFWHTFILFTRDYEDFCRKYFGYTVHHDPTPHLAQSEQKRLAQVDPAALVSNNLELLRKSMAEVERLLGPETVTRWYEDLPRRYGQTRAS